MTTDLTMLVWCVLLALISPYVYVTHLISRAGGLGWGLGNRDQPLVGEAVWALRARRAHANLVENLVPFAALVLTAHAAGKANATTALGAELFFWARLLYLPAYIIGLVPWRTLIFAVATIGEFMILLQLLR